MAVEMICEICGSSNVARDAWATWNSGTQQWELGAVFDYAHCHDCGRETRITDQIPREA